MGPFLQAAFGAPRTSFVFVMRHPLVWALAIEKWIQPEFGALRVAEERVAFWFECMERMASRIHELRDAVLLQLETASVSEEVQRAVARRVLCRPAAARAVPMPPDVGRTTAILSTSLAYATCWLAGAGYSTSLRRCSARRAFREPARAAPGAPRRREPRAPPPARRAPRAPGQPVRVHLRSLRAPREPADREAAAHAHRLGRRRRHRRAARRADRPHPRARRAAGRAVVLPPPTTAGGASRGGGGGGRRDARDPRVPQAAGARRRGEADGDGHSDGAGRRLAPRARRDGPLPVPHRDPTDAALAVWRGRRRVRRHAAGAVFAGDRRRADQGGLRLLHDAHDEGVPHLRRGRRVGRRAARPAPRGEGGGLAPPRGRRRAVRRRRRRRHPPPARRRGDGKVRPRRVGGGEPLGAPPRARLPRVGRFGDHRLARGRRHAARRPPRRALDAPRQLGGMRPLRVHLRVGALHPQDHRRVGGRAVRPSVQRDALRRRDARAGGDRRRVARRARPAAPRRLRAHARRRRPPLPRGARLAPAHGRVADAQRLGRCRPRHAPRHAERPAARAAAAAPQGLRRARPTARGSRRRT